MGEPETILHDLKQQYMTVQGVQYGWWWFDLGNAWIQENDLAYTMRTHNIAVCRTGHYHGWRLKSLKQPAL